MTIKSSRPGGQHDVHTPAGKYVGTAREALSREEHAAANLNRNDYMAGLHKSSGHRLSRAEMEDLDG